MPSSSSSSITCFQVDGNIRIRQAVEQGLGFLDIGGDGVAVDGAVVAKGLNGIEGHGVDGVGADQLIHIAHVAVVGVFGAGAGPEQALHVGPIVGQALPAVAAEQGLEGLVGNFGIGDRDLTLHAFQTLFFVQGIAADALHAFLETVIHLGINAAEEEAGHRPDGVNRLPCSKRFSNPRM